MTRMSDELPDNPFAAIVDHVVETANASGDTSEENISRLVTTVLGGDREDVRHPEDLFDERESLGRIRDYARQRMVAPFATLLGVILRANTAAPAHAMISPMIGSPKPLNMVVVNVGPSGIGKTACDDVAEDYWPADFPVYPLGTAEGACQAFDPDEEGQPRIPNVLFSSSEIDTWAVLGERSGSMTFPVMRQMGTGDMIGQKNASKATTRIVAKRTYRAGISLSAQPGSNGARVLFADAPGGFPQRCVFGSVLDPDAPDEPPTGVEPYIPDQTPDFTPNAGPYYEIPFPESVAAEIRQHRRRVLRGDPAANPLDGHRNLTKAKVAAGLMLLEGRQSVTEDDWRIAERIMDISDATRASLVNAVEQAARTANRARALASADRDEVVETTKLQRTKHTLIKHLSRQKQMPRHDLRKRLRSDQRQYFDAAMTELIDDGHVFAADAENSTTYRIAPESGWVSTWTASPRPKPQLNDGGRQVHVDTANNVTDLDTRRSHESVRPKLSCQKWLNQHVADLLDAGHTTVESFAVIEAGQALGYSKGSIHQAVSAHPDMRTVSRKRGRAIWSITPDEKPPQYESAAAWLDRWLDHQEGDTVTPDDAKTAGIGAGHPWDSVRRAAGLSTRIESIPAHGDSKTERIWRITDNTDGVGA